MPTVPPTLTASPASPDRADRTTFIARAIALDDWRKNFNVPEMVAALTNVYNNAVDAYNNAAAAASSAIAAAAQAVWATSQASLAATQASNAAASASTAVNAPGTSATSTTSLTIANISQTLTIQTGKLFVAGMSVKIAGTVTPTNWMHGDITAYNSGSGVLVVNVTNNNGSGTLANWTVSLSSPIAQPVPVGGRVYFMSS